MPEFKNLTELNKYINQQMKNALQNEVAQVVKNKEQEKVVTEVYEKYTPNNGEPWVYERRGTSGGLADQRNMKSKVKNIKDGVELSVENVTKGKDEKVQISDLVEFGDGYRGLEYDYKENRDDTADQYLQSRPFQERTVDELAQTNEHVKAMKNGLIRQGLNVT